MEEIGVLLAKRNITVVTGGGQGYTCEASVKGAKNAGGVTVGYTMWGRSPSEHIREVVDCSTFAGKKFSKEEQYGLRLGRLMMADAFIMPASEGPGALVELVAIIRLNASEPWITKKRVAIIRLPNKIQHFEAWNSRMLKLLESWGVLAEHNSQTLIKFVDNPQDAVEWVAD